MGAYPYLSDIVFALSGYTIPLYVPTYGVFLALSLVCAVWIFNIELKRRQQLSYFSTLKAFDKKTTPQWREISTADVAINVGWIGGAFGLLGGKLFHILEYPEAFIAAPLEMLLNRGGLSVLGGLILGTLGALLYIRKLAIPLMTSLDAACLGMLMGAAVGRIGCQLAGDGDWGIQANMAIKPGFIPDLLWAQTYEGNLLGVTLQAPGVYPTALYESVAVFCILGLLLHIRQRITKPGWLFSWYLILTAIERLLIEQIRINVTYDWGVIAPTQSEIIASMILIAGIAGVMKTQGRYTLGVQSNKTLLD